MAREGLEWLHTLTQKGASGQFGGCCTDHPALGPFSLGAKHPSFCPRMQRFGWCGTRPAMAGALGLTRHKAGRLIHDQAR